MSTPTVYVICGNNCKYEGMTKEQILAAIMQAVESGEIKDVDTGFITTVLTINNVSLKFFYGTQSAYDALPLKEKANLYAIITNDTFKADVNEAIEQLTTGLTELREGLEKGSIVVSKATSADSATKATKDGNGKVITETYELKAQKKATIRSMTDLGKGVSFSASLDRIYSDSIGCAGHLILYFNSKASDVYFSTLWQEDQSANIVVPFLGENIYPSYFALLNIKLESGKITLSSNSDGIVYKYYDSNSGSFKGATCSTVAFDYLTVYYK